MATSSGDKCPACVAGRFAVASSQRAQNYQVRYLRCNECGRADKQIIPASLIRRVKAG